MPVVLTIAVVLLVSVLYAAVRYIMVGPVPLDQLPLFITNKAISLASLILIALAVAGRRRPTDPAARRRWLGPARRPLGMAGLYLALLHTVLSVMLLNPTYFAKFYRPDGMLSAAAGASLLAGGLALVLLIAQGRSKIPARPQATNHAAASPASSGRKTMRWLGLGVLGLTAAHVGLMGWPGWLTPGSWHGYMPPITLISFVIAIAGLMLGLWPRR